MNEQALKTNLVVLSGLVDQESLLDQLDLKDQVTLVHLSEAGMVLEGLVGLENLIKMKK